MQLDKAVRIEKSFAVDSVKMFETGPDELPSILLSGYASRGYTDTGHKAIDLDGETINQYGIDVSRLETGNIPLLFQHDQSKIIGKVLTASYDTKGLFVTAQLTKLPGDDLTNYTYEAVKAGMLSSFSVGLMVDEIDWTEDDQIEITKSKLFELSVVSTPALASAIFSSTVIKSADGYQLKSVVDVEALKADNPEMCDTLGCLLKSAKKDKPVDVVKAIKDDAKPAVEPAAEPEVEPGVEPEDITPEPEVPAEVTPEPEVSKEVEAPSKTSEETPEPVVEPETPEVTPEVVEEVPEVTPEPEVVPVTLEDAIGLLSDINIENLSDDELEEVFEIVSTLADAVEKKVVAEIAAVMFETEQDT